MGYREVVTLIFVGFGLVEVALGRFFHPRKSTVKDVIIEVVSSTALPLIVIPAIYTIVPWSLGLAFPSLEGALAHWPALLMFGVLLIADDLTQYLWHRSSHAIPWLYRLHRAHHSGDYMSVRLVYRNNIFYYAMMPGLWLSAGLLYLGFAEVYYVYAILKMAVVIGAHSSVAWDEPLYKIKWLNPLMRVLERVISTPATHAAHHGRHARDGVTHYEGNFGNFLFLWDVLFGTAKITRRRPREYGLENVRPASWRQELFWPLSPPWRH